MLVGLPETLEFEWRRNGSPVTTGSATYTVRRNSGSTVQYLQSDGTTFSTTPSSFTAAQTGNAFRASFTPPSNAKGYTIYVEGTHSDATLPPLGSEHYVTVLDMDGIAPQVTADHGSGSYVRNTEPDNTSIAAILAAVTAVPDSLLDLEEVETGLTLRQAFRVMAAVLAGRVSGAGSGTETFKAAGVPGTTRVVSTVDNAGNRSSVVLTP